jgi:hypothetical protein
MKRRVLMKPPGSAAGSLSERYVDEGSEDYLHLLEYGWREAEMPEDNPDHGALNHLGVARMFADMIEDGEAEKIAEILTAPKYKGEIATLFLSVAIGAELGSRWHESDMKPLSDFLAALQKRMLCSE